ncbi:ABC transporter permease subunit [Actinomadura atramentaria]|uniref:ABC transporter permease subunit n=1 Tax=Actinomadura atramentaria TaxID=1990 RepID=UPI00037E6090|nr:ABC transporter permease subunit [Actinomadura atramentaria]
MRLALHAEWTKIRTVAGPLWLLLGTVAATVAFGAVATSVVTDPGDPTKVALVGADVGQAPVAVLAVLLIGGEYGSGTVRTTLTAVPRRAVVLTAKAVTLSGLVAVAGTAAVLGSLVAGRFNLPDPASLADGPTLRASAGTVLYLVLIALLGLGVATAVRDSATGIGIVLALLYIVPIVSQTIGDPHWQHLLQHIAPMTAGLAVQSTTDPPMNPWAGLAVTAGWAAAALLTGGLLLHARDA